MRGEWKQASDDVGPREDAQVREGESKKKAGDLQV